MPVIQLLKGCADTETVACTPRDIKFGEKGMVGGDHLDLAK